MSGERTVKVEFELDQETAHKMRLLGGVGDYNDAARGIVLWAIRREERARGEITTERGLGEETPQGKDSGEELRFDDEQ
ncbi:hypothetical protein J2T57_001357 [Natronocella acetinitrilica]|uniref:Uncharacterized protein n=1 Tax=Natronocella acetinitrilica TaxID=414046 RepID=A0AAE3KAG0_9GAMM|nr:hypothetical protein [Natronocella acetinitrilica]MCP1674255.1 hypothetical protein [Natronocella acetinitrilica]